MKILLVAGGLDSEWPNLSNKIFDYYVGIDHGGISILEAGWQLDLAVGDFDSLALAERDKIFQEAKEIREAEAEKDDTDTQLALVLVLERFPGAQVTIIGATGGRLDHFLANLWLPLEPRFQPFIHQIELLDQQNSIHYYLPGSYTIRKEPEMRYLAYCCLTPVENLILTESKYTLAGMAVLVPTSYASNEFLGDRARLAFDSGMIAVIQSRDKK